MGIATKTRYEELGHWLPSSLNVLRSNPVGPTVFKGCPLDVTKRDCEKIISKLEIESSKPVDELNRIRSNRQTLFKEIDKLPSSFRTFYYAALYYLLLKTLYRSKAKLLLKKIIGKSTDLAVIDTMGQKLKALFYNSSIKLQEKELKQRLKRMERNLLNMIEIIMRELNLKRAPITLTELIGILDRTYEKCEHDEVRFETEFVRLQEAILNTRHYTGRPHHRMKDTILTPLIVYLTEFFLHLPDRFSKTKGKAYQLVAATFNYCLLPGEEQTEEHIRLRYAHHWGRKHKPNK